MFPNLLIGGALLAGSCAVAPAPHAGAGIKCKVQGATDSERSGLTAFRFLVPDGWKGSTALHWLPPDHMAFNADLAVTTPDMHAMVDCAEHTVMTYLSGFGSQPGKGVLITKATDLLHFKVSRLMAVLHGVSDVNIVDEQNTELEPDAAQRAGLNMRPGDSMHSRTFLHQAGYLKVSFKVDGTPMTADMGTEVFGETSSVRLPNQARPSSVSQVNRVGPTITIMLEAAASPKRLSEAKIIASSFQMTPEFHTFWVKLTTHAGQVVLGANRAAAAEANLNWHERSMAAFRQQMDTKSQTTHDFCNMAANQQDYRLGDGFVTLPLDYRGWYDPQAHVLMLDDDPSFVPTGAGTKNYEELHPISAGQR